MSSRINEYIRYFKGAPSAWVFLASILSLALIGLVVLSSATQSFNGNGHYFSRQLMWLCFAVVAGVIMASVDLQGLRKYGKWVGLAAIALLLLVLIPSVGVSVNGARRWVDLGLMRLQVSEFAKVAMVFVLADYLGKNQREMHSFIKGFIIPGSWVGLFSILVILEPDFGTAFLFGAVGFVMVFLAGARFVYLLPTVTATLALFALAVYHDPVRLGRITSFLDVEANRADGAYQLWQGILAFGAGGLSGVGLGNGRQQMAFLPEAHTDFIFPIIGEELGFIFTAAVVVLFMVILFVGLLNLRKANNMYEFSLVSGALLFITFQAIINMAVVTGCMPTKGMSLPFISYGGSNLVLMFAFAGLMLNCFRSWSALPLRSHREL